MRVFISWSGKRSQKIAEILRDWIGDVLRDVKPFVSSRDIHKGEKWLENITKELDNSSYGVICVTPENVYSAWLLFESGALSKTFGEKSSNVCPFLFGVNKSSLTGPLSQFQAAEHSKDDVFGLIKSINARLEIPVEDYRLEKDFEVWWPKLEEKIQPIEESEEFRTVCYVEDVKRRFSDALSSKALWNILSENKYYRKVLLDSINDFSSRLFYAFGDNKEIRLPYVLYPARLVSLLMQYKATVKALALIDVEERFWRDRAGMDILRNTDKNSTRIFVFQTRKQMRETIPTLFQHADCYNVRSISYDKLIKEWPDYVYDFSIIGDISARLLARYDSAATDSVEKNIRFITSREEISRHEDIINSIIQKTKEVKGNIDTESLIEETFRHSAQTILERKAIEMSAYISIPQYDQYEEQHAYYLEMMDRMLEIYNEKRIGLKAVQKVLEFGAGTGLFTKRLAKEQSTHVTAIEIDWACYLQLSHKMKLMHSNFELSETVECFNEDSRSYDPPGTFDFIFSSFADHHIKPYDKEHYFNNLCVNLEADGFAIIGDEFLPRYDKTSVEARRDALKQYHNHIIEIARDLNQPEMAELEEDALRSGLEEIGDFKLSCEEYEELLKNAGLSFEKERIGPKEDIGVGGVYVYVLQKKRA